MIARAIAVTKDYVRLAVGAMLGSALTLFAVSLLVKHPSVFLTAVGSIAALATVVYYFRRQRAEAQALLSAACEVRDNPRRVEYDATGNIVREERIVATKTSGFLMRKRTEYQYWVLLYANYQKPLAEEAVINEIRAHQFAFKSCGIEHVRLEMPSDNRGVIVIACMITQRWKEREYFDSAQCRNVLTHVAGGYSALSPIKLIEGPRDHLNDGTVIEAF